jgi:hypothetical protein
MKYSHPYNAIDPFRAFALPGEPLHKSRIYHGDSIRQSIPGYLCRLYNSFLRTGCVRHVEFSACAQSKYSTRERLCKRER